MRQRSVPFAALQHVRATAADLVDLSNVLIPIDLIDQEVSRGALASQLLAVSEGVINVLDFGADPTGVANSTQAFQDAALAASVAGDVNGSHRPPIRMPTGTYRITDTIDFDERHVVFGDGIESTEINFIPTSGNKPCFQMSEATPYHFFGGFRDFALRMEDYTYDFLTGIRLGQCTRTFIDNVHIQVPGATAKDYVAIEVDGKEQIRLSRCSLQAPVCLYISSQTDNSSFRDMSYLSGVSGGTGLPNTYPFAAVLIDGASTAQKLTFDGHQTCVYKHHFLHYVNTSGAVANGIAVYNLRTEQGPDNTKYQVVMNGTSSTRQVSFDNCFFSSDQPYFLCDNITSLKVTNSRFEKANRELINWGGTGHFSFDRTCTYFTGVTANLGASYDILTVGGAPTGLRDSQTWPVTWLPWTGASSRPVSSWSNVYKTNNVGAATLNAFGASNAPTEGQTIFVYFGDSLTTVDFTGTSLKGNGGVDWTPSAGDSMICTKIGANWYCTISDNT